MFKRALPLLVPCLLAGTLWAATDPFVGDWKLNASRSKLTDVMKVESLGTSKYAFDFIGDGKGEAIVVDGTDQPGIFGTTLSVTVEGRTPGRSSASRMAACSSRRSGGFPKTAIHWPTISPVLPRTVRPPR